MTAKAPGASSFSRVFSIRQVVVVAVGLSGLVMQYLVKRNCALVGWKSRLGGMSSWPGSSCTEKKKTRKAQISYLSQVNLRLTKVWQTPHVPD